MHYKVLLWFYTWNIFTSSIYLAQAFQLTQSKTPYDVVFPPVDKDEFSPPVIMLHGLLDWRKTFKNVAPIIANETGRKVYAYDALNHGDNEWTDDLDLDILVLELDRFMQDLNISVATLVGSSLGGKVAMIYAVEKPEKVEKLILEDISPRKPTAKVRNFLLNGMLLAKMGLNEISSTETDELTVKKIILRIFERYFSKEQMEILTKEFLMDWIPITKRDGKFAWLSNMDLFIKVGRTKAPEDLDKDLNGVYHGDALFIYGTKSVFDVGSDELVKKHFPKATLVEIKGATHFLRFEFVREFEREAINFINKQ